MKTGEQVKIALFKHIKYASWEAVFECHDDIKYENYVRISHEIELTFLARSNEQVIPEQIAMLNKEIQETYVNAERKVAEINEIKSKLLAITNQSNSQPTKDLVDDNVLF